MRDLVQKLVGALECCIAAIERTAHCSEADRIKAAEAARAALSEAKAGGWVAVQGEPWGWAIVCKDGTTQDTRERIRDFFGSPMEMPPYTQTEIDKVDREWAGLAPHWVVTLYALPAPPAQKDNT